MSKSIYEELLEIIDRNIFELPMGFAVLYEIRKKIEQAFKQAQKQEKLLELYREKDKYTTLFIPLPKVELCKYRSIVEQIKELENGSEI